MIEPTDEMVVAFEEAYDEPGITGGDTRAGLAAVFAIVERGMPMPGEPVWPDGRRKKLTLEMESDIDVEVADLGEADRPSQVARLLRQAAADIEQAYLAALAEGDQR